MLSAGLHRDQRRHEASGPVLEGHASGRELGYRKSRRESKKLQRNPGRRAYSFSSGQNDIIQVPDDIHREHPVPPLPSNLIALSKTHEATMGRAHSAFGSQNGTQEWQRVPTLHKRSAQELLRRKSSKKRKEDHDREAEIKAMSASMPARTTTEYGLAGRPMKKDTKRMRGGLLRSFTNPPSDISLPVPESLHSSMSSDSERYTSYELKGFDLFSPRPTIRRSENPRFVAAGPHFGSDGSETRRKISDRMTIPEETLKANKRIHDLADNLDSGSLRELMERDQRRRERKQISEQQKMERRLARRAEKQRMAEAEAARIGVAPPSNMDRGVFGRELIGEAISGSSNMKRKASDASDTSSKKRGKRPVGVKPGDLSTSEEPVRDFQLSASLPSTKANSPIDEQENPVIGTAQVARLSRASISPPSSTNHARDTSNISELMDLARDPGITEKLESSRTNSEASTRKSTRLRNSWNSIKRSLKKKRNDVPAQTSFSNTSRDSTTPQVHPLSHAPPRSSLSTGVPRRTMSRFREDLPDFPLSPPASRMQSPEDDSVPPTGTRHDTPTSGHRSLEPGPQLRNETPTSGRRSIIPSPEPTAAMTQSLASIDSEGSWLSGRPRASSKRGSNQLPAQQLRDSAGSLQKRHKGYSESAEEVCIAEGEYFGPLTPGPEDRLSRETKDQVSGNAVVSSDEEDGDSAGSLDGSTKWGAVGRQPTVIHRQPRAKSREGLLNDYTSDSASDPPEEAAQQNDKASYDYSKTEEPTISRATSVDLGKGHVKHISAGSARLLNLKPRPSGESKRLSTASVS